MGRFKNLKLDGPGKQYHKASNNTMVCEQGIFEEGMLNKGIRVFRDKIEFADPQKESDFFTDYKSGFFMTWTIHEVKYGFMSNT